MIGTYKRWSEAAPPPLPPPLPPPPLQPPFYLKLINSCSFQIRLSQEVVRELIKSYMSCSSPFSLNFNPWLLKATDPSHLSPFLAAYKISHHHHRNSNNKDSKKSRNNISINCLLLVQELLWLIILLVLLFHTPQARGPRKGKNFFLWVKLEKKSVRIGTYPSLGLSSFSDYGCCFSHRKSQMKRVCEVPEEGLSSDMWSWRKYGQKPIKGSPYPRWVFKFSGQKVLFLLIMRFIYELLFFLWYLKRNDSILLWEAEKLLNDTSSGFWKQNLHWF